MAGIYRSAEGGQAVRDLYRPVLDLWPVQRQELRLPTGQGETFVVACGVEGAPPLVLLHGSAANSAMWMADIQAWAGHFRIYAVDMIGEPGLSAPSRPPLKSDAHGLWLDEVLQGLGLEQASLVGVSLGGWLALDYAIRRPGRVSALVLVCPGGVGRQKAFLLKSLPLLLMGERGRILMRRRVFGPAPKGEVPAALKPFIALMTAIGAQFRPRLEQLPVFGDAALRTLVMPVMAIVGGRDALLDSAGTRRRLKALLPQAEVSFLPDAYHLIRGQTAPILAFLRRALGV